MQAMQCKQEFEICDLAHTVVLKVSNCILEGWTCHAILKKMRNYMLQARTIHSGNFCLSVTALLLSPGNGEEHQPVCVSMVDDGHCHILLAVVPLM